MTHLGTMYPFKFHPGRTKLIGKFMTEYRSNGMAPRLDRMNGGSPIT